MKSSILAVVAGLALLAPAGSALAYHLPTPVTVSTSTPFAGGSGEVDLSKPSVVQGTVSVDNTFDGSYWITAGNVSGGESGYGYFIHEDRLFGVTNNGNGSQMLLPLGYVRPGQTISLKAAYTPNDGIRFDTAAVSIDWSQYSRGIIQGVLPNGYMRGLGSFYASVTDRMNSANAWVGSWSYVQ